MMARPMLPIMWLSQCSTVKIGLVRKKNQPQSIESMKPGIGSAPSVGSVAPSFW